MPARNRIPGGLVLTGAVIAALGCFLPWISAVPPQVDTVTRDVFSTAQRAPLPGADGQVIAGLALAGALLGVVMLIGRARQGYVIATLTLGVMAGVIVVADWLDISGSVQALSSIYFTVAEVGAGVYVTAVGLVIWAMGALTGLWRPEEVPGGQRQAGT